jgi:hypothetical protein
MLSRISHPSPVAAPSRRPPARSTTNHIARRVPLVALALCAALWLAACSSTVGGTTNGGPSTPGASATTEHTSSGPIKVSAEFCNRVMTLAESNQIMSAKAANIRVISTDEEGDSENNGGGSCNYETLPFKATVFVSFFPGTGPQIQAAAKAISGTPGFKGTVAQVTGVGDEAQFIVNPIPNTNITQYHLFVKAGTLLFDVAIPSAQPDAGTAQNRAQQVAKLVISRL